MGAQAIFGQPPFRQKVIFFHSDIDKSLYYNIYQYWNFDPGLTLNPQLIFPKYTAISYGYIFSLLRTQGGGWVEKLLIYWWIHNLLKKCESAFFTELKNIDFSPKCYDNLHDFSFYIRNIGENKAQGV